MYIGKTTLRTLVFEQSFEEQSSSLFGSLERADAEIGAALFELAQVDLEDGAYTLVLMEYEVDTDILGNEASLRGIRRY